MKHRGRHRRRRRGRALRATLAGTALALTAAATLISASQATNGTDPGALQPLTSPAETRALELRPASLRSAPRPVAPVGVGAVLAEADRTLRNDGECTGAERAALPVEPAAARAWCWGEADTEGWLPGAVTTSGDADDDGRWGADRVILSGWSDAEGAARVAFVDAGTPGRLAYTLVPLVVPTAQGRAYRPLESRLSGMVWYQDKLLVTGGDGEALHVYDLDRIERTGVGAARGDRFVLSAVATYRLGGDARIGSLSLDRSTTPDTLVASESVPAGSDRPTRLWRYSLREGASGAGLLSTSPRDAYETRAAGVRGVLARGSDWYLARAADGHDGNGTLWRQDAEGARAARCGTDETYLCWSGPAQPLSYWAETGEVWSQSGRMLFSLPLARIDRSLG
ncbi:hypothetical protein [Streptomyces sp. NPDC006610]|jgi:hypothetical protein|uniref:hypothetical protein n=1 Tax=Streptomyces sp. NPDC006610 TaxID=3154584 RepID=UPI0033BA1001